ncbi:hypothetical protein HYDPIDRAFT_108802 [Hydnomerulius pinastri MD-312]|nr:hypothetical protein HYDPIDRAFT_108802 [Hydnomerulius pinastri MD-312]
MLLHAPDRTDVFPRLQRVRFTFPFIGDVTVDDPVVMSACRFVRWCIRPVMTRISIAAPGFMTKMVLDELPPLGNICPRLVDFHVSSVNWRDVSHVDTSEALERAICSLHSLKTLWCSEISSVTLRHVANLANLQSLDLSLADVGEFFDLADPTLGQHSSFFPALRLLRLSSTSSRNVGAFLCANTWNIEELDLKLSPDSQSDDIFASVASNVSPRHLMALYLTTDDAPHDTPHNPPILAINHIKPLFVFKQLTSIVLSPRCIIDIDDDMVKRMALAWPNIQVLMIEQYDKHYICPKVTLPGLLPLIRHCQHLSCLCLAVDATTVPASVAGIPGGGFTNHHITDINVGDSPIVSPGFVAAYLSGFLPRLESFSSWPGYRLRPMDEVEKGYREKWNLVAQLIGPFTMVRYQERNAPPKR